MLIADVLKEIYINDAFHKQFKAAHGGSDGYFAYLRTHGVVYALTPLIKHESPSDCIDVFLSFTNQPHFVISDLQGSTTHKDAFSVIHSPLVAAVTGIFIRGSIKTIFHQTQSHKHAMIFIFPPERREAEGASSTLTSFFQLKPMK